MPQIIIRSYAFQVQHPYQPGQKLGLAEAQLLNAIRAKNLQRSFAAKVEEAEAATPQGALEATGLAQLQAALTKLDQGYVLPCKHEAAPRLSLQQQEAKAIAMERARALGQANGASEAEVAEIADKILGHDIVQQEAARRVAARQALQAQGLEALL